MFGIKFVKVQPTEYILQYKKGEVMREGSGLSFFYFAPSSSLVLVPLASVDVPFIFNEVTADFQEISIQGQLTYRVADARRLAGMMNFSLNADGRYASDASIKLPHRLVSLTQVTLRASVNALPLKRALAAADTLVQEVKGRLLADETIASLGIQILGLSILAIKPTPETARALEAEARELILRQADEAIYARRNSSVEQERAIKENELNTEIAIENKRRQIRETQMEAEKAVQCKKRELQEAEMAAKVALEEKNRELVVLATGNARQEAEAKAYGISTAMRALGEAKPEVLQALANAGMDPGQLIALAFKDLASGADKIGQLNVSPDLLRELMATSARR
jgi:hypothetical protein